MAGVRKAFDPGHSISTTSKPRHSNSCQLIVNQSTIRSRRRTQSASQVETQARQLEARIAKIDGTKHLLPARRYGQPVDMAKIRSNLTLTSLIAQDSAELAHFCGIDPAIRHRIDEEKEARALAAQS